MKKINLCTRTVYAFLIVMLCSCQSENNLKPNVLIILADDAGYADFGFMGSEDLLTPNIDAIAKNGVKFTDAHTTGSVCSPSRAGLMTGRYQQRFGHEHNSPPAGKGMDPDEKTIADVLQTNGYTTGLFGKWHLGDTEPYHPNNRGFDEFYGLLGGHRHYYANDHDDVEGNSHGNQHNGNYERFEGYYTDVLGEKTSQFISSAKDKPFFAFLSFNAVHTPMEATPEDLKRFEGHPRQTLAAMTWAMDRAVGNVMNTLKKEGKLNNTIIFFLSDNGGPTNSNTSNNFPLKSQKGYEYEGGHRIPFLIQYGDKVPQGKTFGGLTSTFDIFPTILSLAGLSYESERPLDGVDLSPYLFDEISGNPHEELYWRIGLWKAARVGDYKLISAETVGDALYNLNDEIGERTDLKFSEPEKYQAMLKRLQNWEKELKQPDWSGSDVWTELKKYVYKDLIDDVELRFKTMGEFKKYLQHIENEK